MSAKKPDGAGTFRDDNWIPKEVLNEATGRFPANLIHDGSGEVVGLFPDSTKGGKPKTGSQGWNDKYVCGDKIDKGIDSTFYDTGGGSAARFFYCAKASKKDRNEGCEKL